MDLLERSSLLEELSGVLAATAAGGRVVLVAGEAGIGKSALVRRFAEQRSADARFLLGACDPLLTPRALGPLHDIARQTGGRLAALLGSGGRGRPSSPRSWMRSRSRRGGGWSWWRTCTGPTRRPLTC
jgi:predicted ATPase